MAIVDATESSQAEGEGPDGSDKPPHGQLRVSRPSTTTRSPPSPVSPRMNGAKQQRPKKAVPLSTKAPGHTRKDLEELYKSEKLVLASPPIKRDSSSTTGSMTPSSSGSLSASESESWSLPSTQPPSRAPSMSSGVSGGKLSGGIQPLTKAPSQKEYPSSPALRISPASSAGAPEIHSARTPEPESARTARQPTKSAPSSKPASKPPSRPSSVHSQSDTGQKFTLKDLNRLLGGPKLTRKTSGRSTASSRKSDSDNDRKSTAGESTISLLKKYGVCEKVAIGKGATSVVRLAHKWDRSEEKLYAVKEFRKRRKNETEKEYVKKLTAEFCISSTLHHINIVETVDLVQDESQHWCEVMEFCPGGDLYAAIKRGGMSPSEVECCFKQILTGVQYLHVQGVAHRDIKPENLFFDTKGHLKIGDYGASTVYRLPWEQTVHMSTGLCGSEPYIAPEQFLGKPYDARLVDIWACGVVYYCLHFQELPWTVAQPTDHLFAAYASACQTQSSCPPTINNLSPRACRPVIRKMLEPNPKLRALIDELVAHPWVESIEVCHLSPKPSHVHVNAQAMAQAQVQIVS
ncbi:hypothetical protein FOMPIDRAFT_1024800 [Fomitopsis schrenkii]|uniref:non-specific serine/threonine protein kinase n=1 Tax=Fomitopsis schrenkii TaxID=2126942 RepID=S8DYH3_FOMSC|nr:hypothetical protein FOMPIDRAFT_1024800 [Fomitopsis schrenkii]